MCLFSDNSIYRNLPQKQNEKLQYRRKILTSDLFCQQSDVREILPANDRNYLGNSKREVEGIW